MTETSIPPKASQFPSFTTALTSLDTAQSLDIYVPCAEYSEAANFPFDDSYEDEVDTEDDPETEFYYARTFDPTLVVARPRPPIYISDAFMPDDEPYDSNHSFCTECSSAFDEGTHWENMERRREARVSCLSIVSVVSSTTVSVSPSSGQCGLRRHSLSEVVMKLPSALKTLPSVLCRRLSVKVSVTWSKW